MLIFKSKQKKLDGDFKIKLCGKRLYPTESVKCLGVKIDTNLSWQYHVTNLSIKLNRANAICNFAIFDSHLSYWCLFWAQTRGTI